VRFRLALRCAEKPATKAGQIKALWPEIAAALERGQSMKSIRKWLEEEAGLRLGITSLTSYISRIRLREKANRSSDGLVQSVRAQIRPESRPPDQTSIRPAPRPESKTPDDPLAQAMRALAKPKLDVRQLHGDGDPRDQNLI
jgi:hypothetical protein